MIVACPTCEKKYTVDPARIPTGGTRARCRNCKGVITIHEPMMTVLEPVIWVLDNDPAISRPVVREALQHLATTSRVRWIDNNERHILADTLKHNSKIAPDALVFGDMHVLLADSLLSTAASLDGVATLLISTHHNIELLSQATEFCRVDQYVSFPVSANDLVELLEELVEDTTHLSGVTQ